MASTNTISGVAQGASAGAAFGPWGAVIGGAIGGIVGLGADKKAKQARRLLKKANALRTDATMLRSFAEQRLLLRQAQLAAAQAQAAGVSSGAELDSSAAQGINASLRNQMFDNFKLGESILNEQLDANVFENRARAKLGQSQDVMGLLGFATQLVGLIPQGGDGQRRNDAGQPLLEGGTLQNPNTGTSVWGSSFDTPLVRPGGLQTLNTSGLS